MRIRSLKPEFFTSLPVSSLSIPARLTFAGLWCYADDEGRGVDDARLVKAALWPLDDVTADDVDQHLAEMMAAGLVVRYRVDDRWFFAVVNWHEHQHPNRPQPSKIPPPPEHVLNAHEPFTESSVNAHGTVNAGREGKGGDRKGGETLAKYLGKLAAESPSVWGSVQPAELVEVGAEYDFDTAAVGRMLGDVWEWWRNAPRSRRWKSAALKGWRSWCKREAERAPAGTAQGPKVDEDEIRRTRIVAELRGEYGDDTERVVDRTLERMPRGPIESLKAACRRTAKELGL